MTRLNIECCQKCLTENGLNKIFLFEFGNYTYFNWIAQWTKSQHIKTSAKPFRTAQLISDFNFHFAIFVFDGIKKEHAHMHGTNKI